MDRMSLGTTVTVNISDATSAQIAAMDHAKYVRVISNRAFHVAADHGATVNDMYVAADNEIVLAVGVDMVLSFLQHNGADGVVYITSYIPA
ncbi:MAG: hypothetical protein DSY80_04165 [Desulfocapsa sp.]|nr:MAG: hypothetical protein DSY80_04165 [Desulfocapsa sp.]